ncbi:MAG: isoprenylcysteine carboxylmethyltransferase family protein [Candidatus Babeliales bacterium]
MNRFVSFLINFGIAFFGLILGPYFIVLLNKKLHLNTVNNILLTDLGISFILLGAILFVYCFGLFLLGGLGNPLMTEPPKDFIEKNIYSYSRNPMYFGYMVILLGESLYVGSFLLYCYFFLIVLLLHYYVIYIEEPLLIRKFGFRYKQYMERVPRWVLKI